MPQIGQKPVRCRITVAGVMCLIYDDEIKFVTGEPFTVFKHLMEALTCKQGTSGLLGRKGSQTLKTADQRALSAFAFSDFFDGIGQLVSRNKIRGNVELIPQFGFPLFTQYCRTNHQQTPGVATHSEFRPDDARFNGLTEADLISNQQTAVRGIQKRQKRLELIGVKLRIGDIQTVDEVVKRTA